ncbi:DUF6443 domain-containing protein [Chryseobacterium sp. SC28]|uniref:DUF6443 domain-containing protein n=1 Tax=Chryseobacterium sp. SC28 TaxID=2268028 RepID=UPI000F64FEFD|nr:DUF6443 domain-containing protein [Chryseobacterium sp. SC28]RRQ46498.1 RHS repeat-associated core domain-containing protein [Chryseobacterium sp. SC28]
MKQYIKLLYTGFLAITGILQAQNLSSNETYVYNRIYLEPVTYNASNPTANSSAKQLQNVQYLDGLGRPKQSIDIGATYNGKDMVSTYFYDPVTGRQDKQYLPVPKATLQGALQNVAEAGINSYYGVTNAFAEIKTENSPLARVLETAAPGDAWQMSSGKTQKMAYGFNTTGEVKKYTAIFDYTTFDAALTQTSAYPANTLYKTTATDEDGSVNISYKNGLGQVLLSKSRNGTDELDTYYVYNQYGQLAFIIPPAAKNQPLDDTTKSNLFYQYKYDVHNRLVEKKLPGKDWERMVYNKKGQVILYQDANLKSGKSNGGSTGSEAWLFTKYDQFGRVVYTGISRDGTSRQSIQAYVDNQVNSLTSPTGYEVKLTSAGFTSNGIASYYSNNSYPTVIQTLLSVNYYDEYPTVSGTPARDATILTQTTLSGDNLADKSTKTLPTASYIKNISDNKWTKTYFWYDEKSRNIGATEINHLGGTTKTYTQLDWAGLTKKVETYHQRLSSDAIVTVKERFEYSSRNFLEKHYHQVDSNPEELLAQYTYNDLGQVTNKKVGGNISSPLQSIDYAYNIRGWLTKVNDPANLNGKLFAYELRYNNPANASLAPAHFNGTITEVDWNSAADETRRRYGYLYDGVNQLTKANYQEPDHTVPQLKFYDEEVSYDYNGNIATLKRNGRPVKGTTPSVVDNLTYFYNGNQLSRITEASANKSGYPGGGLTNTYDPNGNMLTMPDKKITQEMLYNFLNLPENIVQNTTETQYYYRADGLKLKKVFSLSSQVIKTEYLDGFVYTTPYSGALKTAVEDDNDAAKEAATAGQEEALMLAEKRQVAVIDTGNPGNVATKPYFFPTAEGFYDYENKQYIYQYKDHLGNVRLSYAKDADGSAEILTANSYYPFGLNFISSGDMVGVYNPSTTYTNWKFGSKELETTSQYDFGWRQYMPDIGRWNGMDQLSESYASTSPYAYVLNNPVMMYDPDGRVSRDFFNSFWNSTPNGSTSTWTNTGMGFESGDNISVDYNGNYTSLNTNYSNGGIGERIYNISPVVFQGKGNAQTWNMGGNYLYNIWAMSEAFGKAAGEWDFQQRAAAAYTNCGHCNDKGGVIMMDSVWDVLGIALANAKPENKYAALALGGLAIVASKGRATSSVVKGEIAAERGGLNLFKWGAEQTGKLEWREGDYMLHLPNQGTPKLNWKANYGSLRREMGLGNPIYDSYRLPNGNLIPTGGFLNAERFTLQSRGWTYNPSVGAWMPPIK